MSADLCGMSEREGKEFSRKVVHILNSKTQNCVDVAAAQSLCTEPGESQQAATEFNLAC